MKPTSSVQPTKFLYFFIPIIDIYGFPYLYLVSSSNLVLSIMRAWLRKIVKCIGSEIYLHLLGVLGVELKLNPHQEFTILENHRVNTKVV